METQQNTVSIAKSIVRNHAPWIERTLPQFATKNQTPRDLIILAIRYSGFDFFAANSKANELINKARKWPKEEFYYES